jgi:hypothetical protein
VLHEVLHGRVHPYQYGLFSSAAKSGRVITFRRSKVTVLHSAGVNDEFFEDDARVYHPNLQGVITRI